MCSRETQLSEVGAVVQLCSIFNPETFWKDPMEIADNQFTIVFFLLYCHILENTFEVPFAPLDL
jgi:hypothetical protein